MLQSILIDQPSNFFFESNNNWSSRYKMNGKDNHQQQRRLPASYATPPTSLVESPSVEAHHEFEPTIPRTYSTSPSTMPPSTMPPSTLPPTSSAEIQPWMFQLVPEPYAENPAYPAPVENHHPYLHPAPNGLMYHGQTVSSASRTPTIHAYDEMLHGGSIPAEQQFYEPYDGTRALHDLDREVKRVRLSPFSEYGDSSSSEAGGTEWQQAADFARSPQLSARSRGSTPRSSPNIGAYSPDMAAAHHHRQRSHTIAYPQSHLGAPFPGPVRSKIRKVRRKLEPKEREQVHQLRKIGACTKCWGLKMKCDDGSPCKRCEKTGVGAQCVRVHFVDLDVFSKWLVDSYSRSMMHHVLRFTNAPSRSVLICHEKSINVTLPINAHEFIAETPEQLQYWYKDASGWQSTPTTAFAMKRGINAEILEKYIQDHTYYFVETSFGGNHIMADIFMAAFKYARTEENFLLRDTLQLWTAIQLLIKGASLHPSSDLLGMMPINNPSSTQANLVPPPRVLANQIEHSLERRIWQLEKQILSELQKRIFGRKKEDWLKIFFTTVVLMNSLERDSWRLYYWMCHSEQGNTWQHPTAPKRLIEKNDALAESLAAHFAAISKGITPFALDWSREQSFGLIGNCEDPHGMLGAIERIGRGLRNPEHAIYTGNIMAHYSQHDERSLDFLYSSKVMIV